MEKLRNSELIRYEDPDLLVVWKPAGMAVQTKKVTETDLESRLRTYRTEKGEKPDIYVIQRLDQPVEGLLLFAKTKKAAQKLTDELRNGTLQKYYRAKVEGQIPKEEDELRDYLKKNDRSNKTEVVARTNQGSGDRNAENQKIKDERRKGGKNGRGRTGRGPDPARLAILKYRKIADDEVEVKLETGRHHQIRAQLSHAGIPIQGDRKYGAETGGQLCLCSCRLVFSHPGTGKKMEFSEKPTFES